MAQGFDIRLAKGFPLRSSPMLRTQLVVDQGECVAITCADTTLSGRFFSYLIGEVDSDIGMKFMGDQDVSRVPVAELARWGVGFGSGRRRVFQSLTMEEHFRIRLALLGQQRNIEYHIDDAKRRFSVLREVPSTVCGNFSGGQQQSLMIAVAMCGNPRLVVIEEPWMGLAGSAKDDVAAAFNSILSKSASIILICQEQSKLSGLAPTHQVQIGLDANKNIDKI